MSDISSVHISQLGFGGAWNAASRIAESLKSVESTADLDCEIKHGGGGAKFIPRLLSKVDFELQELSKNPITTSIVRGSGSKSWYENLIKKYKSTDIWNLHWLPGLPNPALKRIIQEKVVIWTIHDSNPFTGICHYTMSCEKFQSNCKDCPQILKFLDFAPSLLLNKKKQMVLNAENLIFVAPSLFIMKEFQSSSLGKDIDIVNIPNPVPDLFFASEKTKTGKELTITILGENYAQSKNSALSADAIKRFLESNHSGQVRIKVIGEKYKILQGIEQTCLLTGSTPEQLAEFLADSDIFVYTSIHDNLPNLVLEAQASGNVVIALDAGGISECFTDKHSGFIASANAESISNSIEYLKNNREVLKTMSSNAIDFVQTHFSYAHIGQKYLQLYESRLELKENI